MLAPIYYYHQPVIMFPAILPKKGQGSGNGGRREEVVVGRGRGKIRDLFKLRVLTDFYTEYDTYFEILPKKSSPIIITGKALGMKDVNGEKLLEELRKVKGEHAVYVPKDDEESKRKYNFCLYKISFKAFLDDTFTYTEHYIADYSKSADEIISRLYMKKDLANNHLHILLGSLDLDIAVKVSLLSLLYLDQDKHQQVVENIIDNNGGSIIQNEDILRQKGLDPQRFVFDIYLSNDEIHLISSSDWRSCRHGILSFAQSIKDNLPNPSISKEKVMKAHTSFLDRCNILSLRVLREQNKILIKKIMYPSYALLIPLIIVALLGGIITGNIISTIGALFVYALISVTILWMWRSIRGYW